VRQIMVDEIQVHVLPELQKNLNILATIAKAAPMLGLLGTVLGMISMFQNIAKIGLGDPQKLSNDIGYALVTTAGGLMVTIPIILIHAYFYGQIRNFERELFHYLTRFLRALRKRKEVAQ